MAQADTPRGEGAPRSRRSQAGFLERADRYTLCVVLFAMTLFFAGHQHAPAHGGLARAFVLGMGWLLFLSAFTWLLTFPFSLAR